MATVAAAIKAAPVATVAALKMIRWVDNQLHFGKALAVDGKAIAVNT